MHDASADRLWAMLHVMSLVGAVGNKEEWADLVAKGYVAAFLWLVVWYHILFGFVLALKIVPRFYLLL